MVVRDIRIGEKDRFNSFAVHPVQSWEWGEFKKKTGVDLVRLGAFQKRSMVASYQLTFHPIPKTSYTIGYFPKGPMPDKSMLSALFDLGKKKKAIFIKLEPNVAKEKGQPVLDELRKAFDLRASRAVFTPHTFHIDLTKSAEELLAQMKSKTRYNLRLAKRRGVTVQEDNGTKAFETYLRLTHETASRQGFYAHDEDYHRKMWEILHDAGIARLLTATLNDEILVTWILFIFQNILYYPYGASSVKHRNLMASNLIMWEAVRFGKNLGCTQFDLWGSLGPNPETKDPWYGFHRFKEGYGGTLVEFVGTYDLVVNPQLYPLVTTAEDLRWIVLRAKAKFR